MLMVDKDTLRRKGWRMRTGRTFTYPKHPKEFMLKLYLKGRRVNSIEAEDAHGVGEVVFDRHRGFLRKNAKQLFKGSTAARIEDAIEALHDDYILTM